MNARPPLERNQTGFTLLELLIGLSLMGFILALLFGGFRLASQTWDSVDNKLSLSTHDQAGLMLIRRLIESVQPIFWSKDPKRPLSFAGETDRLSFITTLTVLTGPRVMQFAIEPETTKKSAPGKKIVLREAVVRYDLVSFSENSPTDEPKDLLTNIQSASFAYFGAISQGKPREWHDRWDHKNQLPNLVRLEILRGDGSSVELYMAPVISAEDTMGIRIMAGPQV